MSDDFRRESVTLWAVPASTIDGIDNRVFVARQQSPRRRHRHLRKPRGQRPRWTTTAPMSGTGGSNIHHHDHAASDVPAILIATKTSRHIAQRNWKSRSKTFVRSFSVRCMVGVSPRGDGAGARIGAQCTPSARCCSRCERFRTSPRCQPAISLATLRRPARRHRRLRDGCLAQAVAAYGSTRRPRSASLGVLRVSLR